MSQSLLAGVEMAPRDPILGVTEAFAADTNPRKVNLGVGVYYDDDGRVPVLECVRRVEQKLAETPMPRNYLPIDGLQAYDRAVQELLFGKDSAALREQRIVTVQTLGGTGGLKVGADLLRRLNANAQLYISDPSWENHQALFDYAGYKVQAYPYYDAATGGLRFEAMLDTLRTLPRGSIVLLHACCHNPTGVDLTRAQWQALIPVLQGGGLIPFVDIAYQGFGDGLDDDAFALRAMVDAGLQFFVANSFSKNFSLYGERVGALEVCLFRPFSVRHFLEAVPQSARRIAVLDRTKEPGAVGEPLYLEVAAAFSQATAKHQGLGPLQTVSVVGGRYGLSSKEFTPRMVASIFSELDEPVPRSPFTVGIVDDVSGTRRSADSGASSTWQTA